MENQLDIQSLKGGAIIEMANKELQKMVDDVADINKKADSKRELTIKVALLPTEDGRFGTCLMSVASTLGKQKDQTTSLYFGYDGKRGVASEHSNVSQNQFAEFNGGEI